MALTLRSLALQSRAISTSSRSLSHISCCVASSTNDSSDCSAPRRAVDAACNKNTERDACKALQQVRATNRELCVGRVERLERFAVHRPGVTTRDELLK